MHKCQPLSASIPASPFLSPFTPSPTHPSPTPLVFTPLYLLPCLLPHSFLHPYLRTLSLLRLHSPHSFTPQLIVSSSPPLSILLLSCVLHRYCTFLHNICLSLVLFHCLFSPPPLSLSLLGDPLVTSSLLQLPWFRGRGTVITVWIKQTGSVLLYLTHKKSRGGSRHRKELLFIIGSRHGLWV